MVGALTIGRGGEASKEVYLVLVNVRSPRAESVHHIGLDIARDGVDLGGGQIDAPAAIQKLVDFVGLTIVYGASEVPDGARLWICEQVSLATYCPDRCLTI